MSNMSRERKKPSGDDVGKAARYGNKKTGALSKTKEKRPSRHDRAAQLAAQEKAQGI